MANTLPDNTFTPFNISDDVISGVPSRITYAMWSNNVSILQTFFTASSVGNLTSSQNPAISPPDAKYYYDIYGSANSASAQVELSIAYGNVSGSGAPTWDKDNPTKAVYGQYRNLLLDNPRSRFILNSGSVILNDFFAITIKRANLKQKLDAGNWELHLSASVGTQSISLIDDSGDSQDAVTDRVGRVLNIVSGTIAGGPYATNTKHYGLCYPDYGIIILSPTLVSQSITFYYNTGSAGAGIDYKDNAGVFFKLLSGSSYFAARSEELISSTHYFVRVKNKNYNYSTNPSFYSASDGTLIKSSFANDPHVYITGVGLYDANNELVAMAKLSQPVAKSFEREALIKVRLDF
jgi:hypothetical protein